MEDPADSDDGDDSELDEPVPNAERLVAEAVTLAGRPGHAAAGRGRFWRFAPDEELVGYTAQEMVDARDQPPRAGRTADAGPAQAADHRAGRRPGPTP